MLVDKKSSDTALKSLKELNHVAKRCKIMMPPFLDIAVLADKVKNTNLASVYNELDNEFWLENSHPPHDVYVSELGEYTRYKQRELSQRHFPSR